MGAMVSQITSLTIVYSTFCSGADQRKHQSSTSLAFVRWIHRWPVNSPHKWPVARKIIPFDDVIIFRIHAADDETDTVHIQAAFCMRLTNRPISQIPQSIKQTSHSAPFCNRKVHICAHFCYKMVHCGIWNWCIVGFGQQVCLKTLNIFDKWTSFQMTFPLHFVERKWFAVHRSSLLTPRRLRNFRAMN